MTKRYHFVVCRLSILGILFSLLLAGEVLGENDAVGSMHFAEVYQSLAEIPLGADVRKTKPFFARRIFMKSEVKKTPLAEKDFLTPLFLNKTIPPKHIITRDDVSSDFPYSLRNRVPPSWQIITLSIDSKNTKALSLCGKLDPIGIYEVTAQSEIGRRVISRRSFLLTSSLAQNIAGRTSSLLVLGIPPEELQALLARENSTLHLECSRIWKYQSHKDLQ